MTRTHHGAFAVRFRPWPGIVALLIGLAFMGAGYVRYVPPQVPAGLTSLPEEPGFSFRRVLAIWRDLVGDGIPHPAGSSHNAVVRQRIIDHVETLGLTVEQQVTVGATKLLAEPVTLVNLLVLLPGEEPSATIAVTSHHDSSPAGPGAADNAAAVAISLELMRYYREHPPRNNLLFLITDGEELGLLGAERFVRDHPLAETIQVVVNLEARGTSGPSCLFETGPASHWAIRTYASVAAKPITSSLFYEVYRLLPNNTDFTRYRELPIEGWNFAFVGNVINYHTPNDNIATVDPRSIYHHAQNVQGLLGRLANADRLEVYPGKAVYFDYLALGVVYWWHSLTPVLAVVPTLLFSLAVRRSCRRNGGVLDDGWLVVGGLAVTVLSLAVALLLTYQSLKWQDYFSPPWPKQPLPLLLVFWVIAGGLALTFARLMWHRARDVYLLVGGGAVGLMWLSIYFVPGASYLFMGPALGAGLGGVLFSTRPTAAALVFWFSMAALWLPLEPLFYDALGFMNREVLVVRLLLLTMAAYPLCVCCWQATAADGLARPAAANSELSFPDRHAGREIVVPQSVGPVAGCDPDEPPR